MDENLMDPEKELNELLMGGPLLREGMAGGDAPPQEADSQSNEAEVERIRQEIEEFLTAFPDVKADDIPPEVWELMKIEGISLLGAYIIVENKSLKSQIEAEKQKKENETRSTGSRSSSGNESSQSEFDKWWNED